MAEEDGDEETANEAEDEFKALSDDLESLRLKTLLNGKYDKNNAIISVHAGSGGQMLRTGRKCCSGCTRDGVRKRVIRRS